MFQESLENMASRSHLDLKEAFDEFDNLVKDFSFEAFRRAAKMARLRKVLRLAEKRASQAALCLSKELQESRFVVLFPGKWHILPRKIRQGLCLPRVRGYKLSIVIGESQKSLDLFLALRPRLFLNRDDFGWVHAYPLGFYHVP